ncbi:MAG: hypothetical protein RLZZ356_1202 [Verrucomicrobiota bacterium]
MLSAPSRGEHQRRKPANLPPRRRRLPVFEGLNAEVQWNLVWPRRSALFRAHRTSFAPRAPLTVRATGATRTAGTARTARTAAPWRPTRAQFVLGELAVPVLVEFQQRDRGVLEFVGIDDSVAVGIQGFHQGRNHARTTSFGTAGATGATGGTTAVIALGDGSEGGARQCQGHQGAVECVHGSHGSIVWEVFVVGCRRIVGVLLWQHKSLAL